MKYIERHYERLIERYTGSFRVLLVTGPRQVGKTTMLRRLAEREGGGRGYVSLDTAAERIAAVEDPALFLQRHRPPVLIDEIQYAPGLLPYIKAEVDSRPEERGLYWLTGSQPFRLMQGVSESLAGRVAVVEILGLSQSELEGVPCRPFVPDERAFEERPALFAPQDVVRMFERIYRGSLPEAQELPLEDLPMFFDSYVQTYIMRDVSDLDHVGDALAFRRFASVCAARTGSAVNYADLARDSDIAPATAKRWLSVLERSYQVRLVQPYHNNIVKRMNKQPALHFLDTGVASYLAGWRSPASLEAGPLGGRVFESYVYGEVLKSFLSAGRPERPFLFRTNDRREIDLVLDIDGALMPVEVKKKAEPRRADARSFNVLDAFSSDEIPDGLSAFRRKVGTGAVVCMADHAYPITDRAWAYPAWAI